MVLPFGIWGEGYACRDTGNSGPGLIGDLVTLCQRQTVRLLRRPPGRLPAQMLMRATRWHDIHQQPCGDAEGLQIGHGDSEPGSIVGEGACAKRRSVASEPTLDQAVQAPSEQVVRVDSYKACRLS
jgi:hypothetical protein